MKKVRKRLRENDRHGELKFPSVIYGCNKNYYKKLCCAVCMVTHLAAEAVDVKVSYHIWEQNRFDWVGKIHAILFAG